MMKGLKCILGLLLTLAAARAEVEVTVSSTETTGGKATVNLALTNTFSQPVKEARVWVFLMDADGKVVGNKAQWVVGATDTPKTWPAGESQRCAVTVDVVRPVASTRVIFSRLTLADGTEVNPQKQVKPTLAQP